MDGLHADIPARQTTPGATDDVVVRARDARGIGHGHRRCGHGLLCGKGIVSQLSLSL